ncbi:MAG: hypothetical protein JNK32_01220 [Anaerolineales bacterium]|nr:hypothetical protein [Anaerolineales bacterium]
MKFKPYLLISCVALLAVFLSACGAASVDALAQTGSGVSASVADVPANTESETVSNALNQGGRNGGERDLTVAAEALGVTVEELQQALQNAKPAECTTDQTAQPANGVDCRPDLDAVAEALGVTVEEVQSALGGSKGERDLTAAAETLGVTVEELQQALQNSRPAECVAPAEGTGQSERPANGVDCRPDFEAAAETLGVTAEELQSALGGPMQGGHEGAGRLENLAETLGVTVEELQQAFQDARPAECPAPGDAQSGQPASDVDCHPDLEAAAESLGITAEELEAALGDNRPGGGSNFEDASEALGVTVEELQQALQDARPAECAAPAEGSEQSGQPGQGTDCRPNLDEAAESLGITTEELQSALGKPPKGGDGQHQQDGPGNGGPGNGGPGNGGPGGGGPGGNQP